MTAKLDMKTPDDLRRSLARLTTARGNAIFRLGLRAAERPARKSIKQLVAVVRRSSRQSTGATHRAVQGKVTFPAKRRPGWGYMLSGVDFEYSERHFKTNEYLHRATGSKKRRLLTGLTNQGRRGRKGQSVSKRYVKSWQRRGMRTQSAGWKSGRMGRTYSKGRNYQLNIPGKYWHLIDLGFKHWSGTSFPGHAFIAKAFNRTAAQSISKFDEIVARGLQRELSI